MSAPETESMVRALRNLAAGYSEHVKTATGEEVARDLLALATTFEDPAQRRTSGVGSWP